MLADKIITFNEKLHFSHHLPEGFALVNPFRDNPETMKVMAQFYQKFYRDSNPRKFIIGINPSRHGAGITGVPFTDTKRLHSVCGIKMQSAYSHEPSSVFMYDIIEKYGGAKEFYADFYINSPFPLAIVRKSSSGKWLNANYYDDKALFNAVKEFMIESLKQHLAIGLHTETAFVLGTKNASFLAKINTEQKFFKNLIVLEHPRYIQQYKTKQKPEYIDKYLRLLQQ